MLFRSVRFIDGRGCSLVLSEPLDAVNDHWREVGEGSFVIVENDAVEVTPFSPSLRAAA